MVPRVPIKYSFLFLIFTLFGCMTSEVSDLIEPQSNPQASTEEELAEEPSTDIPLDWQVEFSNILYQDSQIERARNLWLNHGPFFSEDQEKQNASLRWLFSEKLLLPQAMENPGTMTVIEDDLWIGGWNGGLTRYSLVTEDLDILLPQLESLSVQTMQRIQQMEDHIIVAQYNGIKQYHLGSQRWTTPDWRSFPGRLRDLLFWRDNWYLATANRGLYRLDSTKQWQYTDLSNLRGWGINNLKEIEGRLFILSAESGLGFLENNQFSPFSNQAIHENITTLDLWQESYWAGSYGGGLYQMDSQGNLMSHWTERDGTLTDDWILTSCATEKYLFIGTLGGGVILWDDQGRKTEISLRDGLGSMDIAALAWYNEHLYVGCLGGGVTSIHEELIQQRLQNP